MANYKNVPFLLQLSSVQAGGSTAFIYANFSAPVVEVSALKITQGEL